MCALFSPDILSVQAGAVNCEGGLKDDDGVKCPAPRSQYISNNSYFAESLLHPELKAQLCVKKGQASVKINNRNSKLNTINFKKYIKKQLFPTHCIAVQQENTMSIAILLQVQVKGMEPIKVTTTLQSSIG